MTTRSMTRSERCVRLIRGWSDRRQEPAYFGVFVSGERKFLKRIAPGRADRLSVSLGIEIEELPAQTREK